MSITEKAIEDFLTLNPEDQVFIAKMIANIKSEDETGESSEHHGVGYLKNLHTTIEQTKNKFFPQGV